MEENKKDKDNENIIEKYFDEDGSGGPIFFSNKEIYLEWKKSKDKSNYFLAKDNFWSKETQTTSSSLFLDGFFPLVNSTVINLLERGGYKLLGKTYLDEFACGGLGISSCDGPIFNPYDKERVVGGSSSGSAFSVAKDIVTFSIGHDAGDSVRRPSSYCGIIGFKPSYGSISRYGIIPMASSFDTVGIMSKDIKTIKKVYEKISEIDYKDITTIALRKIAIKKINAIKKIAVFKDLGKLISEDYYKIYAEKLEDIRKNKNCLLEEISIPEKIRDNLQISYLIICSSEITSHLNSLNGVTYGCKDHQKKTLIEKRSSLIGKWAKERIIIGNYFLEEKDLIKKANQFRSFVTQWIGKIFEEYDFLIFPGTEDIAPKFEDVERKNNVKKSNWIDNLMLLSNLAGNPSINVPLGKVRNMPVSLNIDSSWRNEEELLEFVSKEIIK